MDVKLVTMSPKGNKAEIIRFYDGESQTMHIQLHGKMWKNSQDVIMNDQIAKVIPNVVPIQNLN